MQHEAEPDRAISIRNPAEKNAREDRGERLGHRFLKMDHTIRHGHYQYRIHTERRFEAVNKKAAKEKLKPEKLKEIDQLPDQQRRAPIRIAVINLEKWIFA